MASSINNAAWMEWMSTLMGGMSRQTLAAAFPPDRFYCLLDELPMHLLPQTFARGAAPRDTSREPLFLNPNCILCDGEQVPDEFVSQRDLLAGFALQGTTAWVMDESTGTTLPFWLGSSMAALVRSLRAGGTAPNTVPSDSSSVLAAAGILIPEGHQQRRHHELGNMVAKAGPLFQHKGYAPLSNLIHPFHVAALRRYYRHLIRTGRIRLGDGQSPRRYIAYNEPVARYFHRQITATLSAVVGEPVKPSYVYLASYLAGAELKKHTDREQCEFSVTLCLDYSPEPAFETPWPIRLDTPSSSVTVYQALGDGLAYRGTRLPHYRDVLPQGQTSTSIFFHYVAQDFAGSLD